MPHFHSRRPGRDSGVLASLAAYEEALQGAVHASVRGFELPGGGETPTGGPPPGSDAPPASGEPRPRIRGSQQERLHEDGQHHDGDDVDERDSRPGGETA